MKKIFNALLIYLVVSSFVTTPGRADEVPHIIESTAPISSELKGYINAWLESDNPSDAIYYIVTYAKETQNKKSASLAGVNLSSPDDDWSLEEDNQTIWIGSVVFSSDGEIISHTAKQHTQNTNVLMRPSSAAGGGSYVMFPWEPGKAMKYGIFGVHDEGGYGTVGMQFVDFISGDDLGISAASPAVLASDAGIVDYVCNDGVTVAIRTHNSTTGDYFLYAHMLENDNLELSHTFPTQGNLIGILKYGSFAGGLSPNCGWAIQQPKHYHLHWGFVPSGDKYQVGGCVISMESEVWTCGDNIVKTNGWLIGSGGYVDNNNIDPITGEPITGGVNDGGNTSVPGFWDYMLTGLLSVADQGIVKLLPAHQPFQYTYVVFNVISLFFRLVWVFAASNVNLEWLFAVILLGFAIKAVFFVIWGIAAIFRIIKLLPAL